MKTKLVIFDLDGTLLDTIDDIAAACNHALKACGFPERKRDEYYMLVGRGITNLFRGALPEGMKTEHEVERMRGYFLTYYNAHSCDLTKPYAGIVEMLTALSSKGIRFAIASNKYQEGTENLVRRFFGEFRFECILGQRDGKPIKPDPQIVLEAMKAVPEITREEVVYCGDSDVDMMTGNNAGVRTIGVTWGFRSREELYGHNPWILVDRPEEITDALTEGKE